MMVPRDCTEKVYRMQYEMWMSLPPEERFRRGMEMCEEGERIMQAGVRARFPDATPEQFQLEMLRHLKRMNPEKLAWMKVDG